MSADVITQWSDPPPIKVGDFIDIRYYDYSHMGGCSGRPRLMKLAGMVLRINALKWIDAVYVDINTKANEIESASFLANSPIGIWVRSRIDDCEADNIDDSVVPLP